MRTWTDGLTVPLTCKPSMYEEMRFSEIDVKQDDEPTLIADEQLVLDSIWIGAIQPNVGFRSVNNRDLKHTISVLLGSWWMKR